MSFQTPITIREAIKNVHERRYLLPAIQRELVWGTEKIENLFDSIMRGYPIGSFLFWAVEKEKSKDYQFYEFIRDYHTKNNKHNPPANISGEKEFTAILDGQQRLTSLYIGLKGTFTERTKYKWKNNPDAYLEKKLYLNLSHESDDPDRKYDFQFLTELQVKGDKENRWFLVGNVLDFEKQKDLSDYIQKEGLKTSFSSEALFGLREAVMDKSPIVYYLEHDQDPDKVLNIFIRVNSAGEPLGYSDLLMSMATASWTRNARELIHKYVDDINQIKNGFNFNKDFVLKACLVLGDLPDIRYSVGNFTKSNVTKIDKEWDKVSEALRLSIELVADFGFNRQSLTANNAVIPIAYYLKANNLGRRYLKATEYIDDRKRIKRWLIASLLKGVFGGKSDTILSSFRTAMREAASKDKPEFPVGKLDRALLGMNISLKFEDQEIEDLLDYEYGNPRAFAILALVYPSLDYRDQFHQDHIHPKDHFHKHKLIKAGVPEQDIEHYKELVNTLPNLQLLRGPENLEKKAAPLTQWVATAYTTPAALAAYKLLNHIPETSLELKNFLHFYKKRREILFNILKGELA